MVLGLVREVERRTLGAAKARGQDRNVNARRVAELIQLQRPPGDSGLSEQQYRNEAARYGINPAALHAFSDVESGGEGYTSNGRLKIMYEPHIFSQLTNKVYDGVPAGDYGVSCSYPSWCKPPKCPVGCRVHPYSLDQEARWGVLAFAAELNFEAALGACSWGAFQILGKWWKQLGYPTVWHFVVQMNNGGSAAHLNAAMRFLQYNGVIDEMKRGEWSKVIEAYNGGGNVDVYLPRFLERLKERSKLYVRR